MGMTVYNIGLFSPSRRVNLKKITLILTVLLAFVLVQTLTLAGVDNSKFVILDENVDEVIKGIGSGSGTPEKVDDAYQGKEALYIGGTGGDGQNYNANMPKKIKEKKKTH